MIPYTYPMSKTISELVEKIAQMCRSENACTGFVEIAYSGSTIRIGKQEHPIPINNTEFDLVLALCQLGFINSVKKTIMVEGSPSPLVVGENFLVLDDLFKWADYLKKNRVRKWFIRTFPNIKDVLLGISFTASLVLIAIQIIQAFQR